MYVTVFFAHAQAQTVLSQAICNDSHLLLFFSKLNNNNNNSSRYGVMAHFSKAILISLCIFVCVNQGHTSTHISCFFLNYENFSQMTSTKTGKIWEMSLCISLAKLIYTCRLSMFWNYDATVLL